MGFFNKIFSFIRDALNISESKESPKNLDSPLDTVSVNDEPSSEIDRRDDNPIDSSVRPVLHPVIETSVASPDDSADSNKDDSKSDSEQPSQFQPEKEEESYIDRIRREEEERKKREWLDFLKTKRAKRRKELEEELEVIDKQLAFIQERLLAIKEEKKGIVKKAAPDFSLNPSFSTPKPANQFNEKEFDRIITMRELFQQRIEEEWRRKEEAERTARINLQEAKKAIQNRNISRARECLDILSKQTPFIEDRAITDAIKDVVFAITELSNQLEAEKREREEQKRKKEALAAKQRAEALERQRQEDAARKLREEEGKEERARKYEEELRKKEKRQQKENSRLRSLYLSFKQDAPAIVKFLRDNGVKYFYHFTDESNIPLIKFRKGLYSWSYLLSHGLNIPEPGGDAKSHARDRDRGLQDYVRLSFCKNSPIAYRIHQESKGRSNLVLLKITIDVAMFESTLFSDMDATEDQSQIGSDKNFLEENLDLVSISFDGSSSDPYFKNCQAEVLVKTLIPTKYIVNLDNPENISFKN